jgi:membrane protein required for colicin V production
MTFDLLLAAAVAAFALSGLSDGLVRQVTHWTGLAIGYLVAWPLATKLTPSLAPRLRIAPIGVGVSLAAVLYLAFYAAGAIAVQSLIRRTFGEHEKRSWDRWGGAAFGATKGAVILYMALSALLFYEKPLTAALGRLPAPVRASRVVALVRRHDVFTLAPQAASRKK